MDTQSLAGLNFFQKYLIWSRYTDLQKIIIFFFFSMSMHCNFYGSYSLFDSKISTCISDQNILYINTMQRVIYLGKQSNLWNIGESIYIGGRC